MNVGGVPHIVEKLLTKATIFFKHNFNQRFAQKNIGVQSGEIFHFENFGIANLEVPRKMTFGCNHYGLS